MKLLLVSSTIVSFVSATLALHAIGYGQRNHSPQPDYYRTACVNGTDECDQGCPGPPFGTVSWEGVKDGNIGCQAGWVGNACDNVNCTVNTFKGSGPGQ